MSQYALFIWSAYGATAIALGGLVLASLAARRQVRRELSERGLDRPREQRAGIAR
jgi:heme exporter protein CcmD